jgi:hypothetical protein
MVGKFEGCLRGRQIRCLGTSLGGAPDHSHERMMKEERLPSWKSLQGDISVFAALVGNTEAVIIQMQHFPRIWFEWVSKLEECWRVRAWRPFFDCVAQESNSATLPRSISLLFVIRTESLRISEPFKSPGVSTQPQTTLSPSKTHCINAACNSQCLIACCDELPTMLACKPVVRSCSL